MGVSIDFSIDFSIDSAMCRPLRRYAGQNCFARTGDASRWFELANINGLKPPYITDSITDDKAQASDVVLLTGSEIRIPSSNPIASAVTDPDIVFGTDVQLNRGELTHRSGSGGGCGSDLGG